MRYRGGLRGGIISWETFVFEEGSAVQCRSWSLGIPKSGEIRPPKFSPAKSPYKIPPLPSRCRDHDSASGLRACTQPTGHTPCPCCRKARSLGASLAWPLRGSQHSPTAHFMLQPPTAEDRRVPVALPPPPSPHVGLGRPEREARSLRQGRARASGSAPANVSCGATVSL